MLRKEKKHDSKNSTWANEEKEMIKKMEEES